jgi:beta-lactam-binding protein with PASTA domain
MAQEIEITIEPDGKTYVDLINFKGKKCSETMQELERGLGQRVSVSQKPEFFQSEGPKEKDGLKGKKL